MENNKKEINNTEITLTNIVKVLFHRYVLLGCITGATLLVGTLGLNLIGKSKETYVSSFKYTIPSIQNNKYLDGSNFDFQDVLSKSNIGISNSSTLLFTYKKPLPTLCKLGILILFSESFKYIKALPILVTLGKFISFILLL